MQSKEENGLIMVRLFSGEDIYQSLKTVCQKHKVETAVVLSGIGQLKQFKLGYFKEKGNYTPQEFAGAYELLSLAGIITRTETDYKFHLHAALGDENKRVVGGHLLSGLAEVTNEIVLLKSNIQVERRMDERYGLEGLFPEG
jgi:predicted DNA-binding protein with PD1-like motif